MVEMNLFSINSGLSLSLYYNHKSAMNRFIRLLFIILLPVLFSCSGKEQEPQVIHVESVSLNQTSASLTIGGTLQLKASVSPSTATNKKISWSSTQPSVASVSPDGLVTALSEGTATITASADGKKGECTVSVSKGYIAVSGVKLDKTELSLYEGEETVLTATVLPEDATEKTITWSSSDNSIATVEDGKVKAIKEGTATITASVESIKVDCSVTVYMQYGKIAITDLKPVDILPVIGQVEVGDKQCYNHIEHLRLAEATRIRDMMWEYGAGSHSKEEYQQLMGRLVAGMMEEYPLGYDNFEIMGGGQFGDDGINHSHMEWSILNSLIQHAHMNVVFSCSKDKWWNKLRYYISGNPDAFVIMGCSACWQDIDKESFIQHPENESVRELCQSGKLMIIKSGGNIYESYSTLINKTYHRDVNGDKHGFYSLQANANGKNEVTADIALLLTVGTNAKGDIDQTDEITSSSVFPVGFHDKVLFSGRAFPMHSFNTGQYEAEGEVNNGKYATSFTNYVNVAMMSVCFQMYAEAKDVFELLDMVRSTCLTDYIRFYGQTQPLQLINPAGLYKKYLTPQNLPESISTKETLSLDKGYYKGVIFSIPGAEVKINGEWVAFDNKNKDIILAQNPMNLEWRLNGDLLRKMGYTSGQTIEGQIITVDDRWGDLRLEVPMTIIMK